MDVLIERAPMESTMRPVVPCVFQHKEHGDLVPAFRSVFNNPTSSGDHSVTGTIQHCEERGERYAGSKPDPLSHGVEEPMKRMNFRSH